MTLSIVLVIVWVAIATYGDVQFKAASGAFTNRAFLVGCLAYASTSALAVLVFHRQQWGWTILLWNCLSLLLSIALSVVLFHEALTFKRILATALVLIAILLTEA